MTYYFEKTIVDAKDIYTNYLVDTLTPLLYEGFYSIYEKARSLENTYIQASKIDPDVKNPGVLVLFQHFLIGVDKLSDNMIDEETKRIRDNSKCSDIFDQLIKAVMKSHIIVLTYTASGQKCKLVTEKMHEKIESKYFIHKCYVECARLFYDHSALFWHEFSNSELKDNQRIIYQLTKIGIKNAIKRCLPMKELLETYLNNDYVEEESANSENEYVKVKDLLQHNNKRDDGGIMKIINTTESESEDITKLETNVNDLSSLIFNRNIYDTLDGKSPEANIEQIINPPQFITNPINKENNNAVESDNEIKIQKSEIKHSEDNHQKHSDIKQSMTKRSEDNHPKHSDIKQSTTKRSETKQPEADHSEVKRQETDHSEVKRREADHSEVKRREDGNSEIKHSDPKDNIIAQKYIEAKAKREAEQAKQLEEQFFANSKGKNVKANILLDAIQIVDKNSSFKNEQNKSSGGKIIKKQHSHSMDENDNFFEEIIR